MQGPSVLRAFVHVLVAYFLLYANGLPKAYSFRLHRMYFSLFKYSITIISLKN